MTKQRKRPAAKRVRRSQLSRNARAFATYAKRAGDGNDAAGLGAFMALGLLAVMAVCLFVFTMTGGA